MHAKFAKSLYPALATGGYPRIDGVKQYATPYDMLTSGNIQEYTSAMGTVRDSPMAASIRGLDFLAIAPRVTRGEFIWARVSKESEYKTIEEWATGSMDPDLTLSRTCIRVYTTADLNRHLADLQINGAFLGRSAYPGSESHATPRYRTVRDLLAEVPFYCVGCVVDCVELTTGSAYVASCSVHGPIYPGDKTYRVRVTMRGPVEHARNLFDPVALAGYTLYALVTRVPTTTSVGNSFLSIENPTNPETLPLFDIQDGLFGFPTSAAPDTQNDVFSLDYASIYDVHPRKWIYQIILYSSCNSSRVFGLDSPCMFDPATGNIDCARIALGTVLTCSPAEAADALEPPFLRAARRSPTLSLPDLALRFFKATHPTLVLSSPLFRIHASLSSMLPEIFCNVGNDVEDLNIHLETANLYKFNTKELAEPVSVDAVLLLEKPSIARRPISDVPVGLLPDSAFVNELEQTTAAEDEMDVCESLNLELYQQQAQRSLEMFRQSCYEIERSVTKIPTPITQARGLALLDLIRVVCEDKDRCQQDLDQLNVSRQMLDEVESIFCRTRTCIMNGIAVAVNLSLAFPDATQIVAEIVRQFNVACTHRYMYCACHFKMMDSDVCYIGPSFDPLVAAVRTWSAMASALRKELFWTRLWLTRAFEVDHAEQSAEPLAQWRRVGSEIRAWKSILFDQLSDVDLPDPSCDGLSRALAGPCLDGLLSMGRKLRSQGRLLDEWQKAWSHSNKLLGVAAELCNSCRLDRPDQLPPPLTIEQLLRDLGKLSEHAVYKHALENSYAWAHEIDQKLRYLMAAANHATVWQTITAKQQMQKSKIPAYLESLLDQISNLQHSYPTYYNPVEATRTVADKINARVTFGVDDAYARLQTRAQIMIQEFQINNENMQITAGQQPM